jgi:hypothetical protein
VITMKRKKKRTHLRPNDPVPAKEGRGEDVHGAALAVRHACLPAEELGDDALGVALAYVEKRQRQKIP